jgi:lipid-A-disaccharide synthase
VTYKIAISAGEVSGDQHLARVVRTLKARLPDVQVRGMAGRECEQAGAELVVDAYRKGSTMGFTELVRSASSIFSSFKTMRALLEGWRPDLLILVDYPDFNLRLARVAKSLGVRVLYYIPPKVWAWRSKRVEKIRKYVDHVAAIFPFENDFYQKHGVSSVTFVGHPLGDLEPPMYDERGRGKGSDRVLLMLPGSRKFEVEKLLPGMLRAFEKLQQDDPGLRARVLLAPNMSREWVMGVAESVVGPATIERVQWVSGDALHEMANAWVGILKSGTCNLEAVLGGLPFVCVYSGSWIAKVIVSLLVPLKEFSPVNIIRAGTVTELMQVNLDEERLYREVRKISLPGPERDAVAEGLQEVRSRLFMKQGEGGSFGENAVSHRVVDLVLNLLHAH